MAANTIPYVQDADQWVSYYLSMAEKKVLDPRNGYATGKGSVLYPVENKNVMYKEKEEPPKEEPKVDVTLVTPIQQTVEQVKEDLKDEKEAEAPALLSIKAPVKRKTVSRRRTGKEATRVRDQLSKSHK